MLQKAARWKLEIDENEFGNVARAAGYEPGMLPWTYADVNSEMESYIKKHTQGRARKALLAAKHGGFDGYRRLVTEIDPVNHRTKAAMTETITKMVQLGASQNPKILKSRLLDLETLIKRFLKKTNEMPEESLLASVLANLLDPKTRDVFVNEGIMHDFRRMQSRINETATEADAASPMDIGSVEAAPNSGQEQSPSPAAPPTLAAVQQAAPTAALHAAPTAPATSDLNAATGGKPPNPHIICFKCNQKGHPSFMCPLNANKGSWQKGASKGGGGWNKGGNKGQFSKGGWGKGKSKGAGRGGKGAYAVEDDDSWWDGSWWGEPSSFAGLIEEDEDDEVILALECNVEDEEVVQVAVDDNLIFSDGEDESTVDEPVAQKTIPNTKDLIEEYKARQIESEERDRRILNGTNLKDYNSPMWCRARWTLLETMPEMLNEKDLANEYINQKLTKSAPIAETPQTIAEGEPWQVKVLKHKQKKLNANQRRAAARAPKSRERRDFAGLFEDPSADGEINVAGDGQWEKVELTVDSGAAETICPAKFAGGVPVVPGAKIGRKYTCAGGKPLYNLGEKRCVLASNNDATEHNLTLQVADVTRALLSVSKAVDGGNRVVFDQDWSYIEDRRTGKRTTITRQGMLYVLEAWVKKKPETSNQTPGFPRPVGPR